VRHVPEQNRQRGIAEVHVDVAVKVHVDLDVDVPG